jgi:hypothetical protein
MVCKTFIHRFDSDRRLQKHPQYTRFAIPVRNNLGLCGLPDLSTGHEPQSIKSASPSGNIAMQHQARF